MHIEGPTVICILSSREGWSTLEDSASPKGLSQGAKAASFDQSKGIVRASFAPSDLIPYSY